MDKDLNLIRKILRLNEYVLIFVIIVNFLFLCRIGVSVEWNPVNSYLVDYIVARSQFPVLTNNSLEFTLVISAIMFLINLPVSICLALLYIKDRHNEIFEILKSEYNKLYIMMFQAIYPDEYYTKILEKKGFFRVFCFILYLLVLFVALEWYVWVINVSSLVGV